MASNPPAEAPIPTIRKPGICTGRSSDVAGVVGGNVTFTSCRLGALFLARVLAMAVLPEVFRAAATEPSPQHDGDRGIEKSSRAAERLIRSQSLSLFPMPDKQEIAASNVFCQG